VPFSGKRNIKRKRLNCFNCSANEHIKPAQTTTLKKKINETHAMNETKIAVLFFMIYLFLALQSVGQPVQSFIQAISSGRTGGLNIPLSISQLVQTQFFSDFVDRHGVW